MGIEEPCPGKSRKTGNTLQSTKGGALLMGRRCYEDFTDYAQDRRWWCSVRFIEEFPYAWAGNLQDGGSGPPSTQYLGLWRRRNIRKEPLAKELYLTQIDAEYEGMCSSGWENFFKREISRKEVNSNGLKPLFEFWEIKRLASSVVRKLASPVVKSYFFLLE